MWFKFYFYGTALVVVSVLLLPQCVFPHVTRSMLGAALGQQGQQSGKRPRCGAEENENKRKLSKHCLSLHLPVKIYRSDNHYLPLHSESYASSFFNCSNSELYREGSNEKHSSQTDQFVRTIGTIEQISMVSKRVLWTGRCWKPCHKKNCLMKLKIIILG